MKPRRKWRRRLIWIGLITTFTYLIVSVALALAVYSYGRFREAPDERYDVIIVLGSGLTRRGAPGPALIRRSREGAELWQAGYAPNIICTGGVSAYATRSEADGCREILLREGVAPAAISLEERSRSTEENALYAGEIMRANGWHNALIVSDAYHLLRAEWIFRDSGIAGTTAPPDTRPPVFTYATSIFREVIALQWYAFKSLFGIDATYVPVV